MLPTGDRSNSVSLSPLQGVIRDTGGSYENFSATKSKEIYRVADPSLTVSFPTESVLSPLTTTTSPSLSLFPQTGSGSTHVDFQANMRLRGDLYGNLCDFKNLHIDLCLDFSINL
ncbi:unnamed protein product [Brassica rapa subsp. narinosa]